MSFVHKEGTGTLFQNDKKANPKAPDYRGEVMIAGNLFELAGWKKMTSKGDPMLSLSAKVKDQSAVKKEVHVEQGIKPVINNNYGSSGTNNFSDDIPFAHHGKCGAGVSWRAI